MSNQKKNSIYGADAGVFYRGDHDAFLSSLTPEEQAYMESIWYAPTGPALKLIVNRQDVTSLVTSFEWSGAKSEAARKLTFSLAACDARYMPTPDIKLHHMVQLYEWEKELFRGYLISLERSVQDFNIPYTAYDGGFFLANNKVTTTVNNETPDAVTRRICSEVGVPVGETLEGEVYERVHEGDSVYEVIMTGYTISRRATGIQYCLEMDRGAVNVRKKGDIVYTYQLNTKRDIYESTYRESSEQAVNRVKLYGDEGQEQGELTLPEIKDFPGILQAVYKGADEKAAKELLQGVSLEAKVGSLGYSDCITNRAVVIHEPISGMDGLFYIDGDRHRWENGQHLMELDLNFQNFMDAHLAGSEPEQEAAGGFTPVPEDSNAARIWNCFRSMGYSAAATAGILGNMSRETGGTFDPAIKQQFGGPGRGLCQWTFSERWQTLVRWAKTHNLEPESIEAQCKFVDYELRSGALDDVLVRLGGLENFKKATDAASATQVFYDVFERGANRGSDLAKSTPVAQQFFTKWKDYEKVDMSRPALGTGRFGWPCPTLGWNAITQGFMGQRSYKGHIFRYATADHLGIDIGGGYETTIVAADSGTVIAAGGGVEDWSYGNSVCINHGNGFCTRYAHLNTIHVRVGQNVRKGQLIGGMGSTGASSGPHLHFEVVKGGQWGAHQQPLDYVYPDK